MYKDDVPLMRSKFCLFILFFYCFYFAETKVRAQECKTENKSFSFGEQLDYVIYYYLAGIWVSAGEVTFKVDSAIINKQLYYHFDSYGTTLKRYDWIYRVRDKYEAYTHSTSFRPLRFKRSVEEGSTYIKEDYLFNQAKGEVYTLRKLGKKEPLVKDTVISGRCSFDPISMIYYARNIDFTDVEVNEEVPLQIFLDNQLFNTYLRYLGKETIKIKDIGEFRCIVFSPLLIEGSIFNSGEDMTVWVTDDKNRVPLLIETPILVGDIRARATKLSGLRYPLDSKITD